MVHPRGGFNEDGHQSGFGPQACTRESPLSPCLPRGRRSQHLCCLLTFSLWTLQKQGSEVLLWCRCGLNPRPGTSTCFGCSKKKKKIHPLKLQFYYYKIFDYYNQLILKPFQVQIILCDSVTIIQIILGLSVHL